MRGTGQQERRPVIFCFINSGMGTEWVHTVSLAEDGTCLAQHLSSNDTFARFDSGFQSVEGGGALSGPGQAKREAFEAHYPDGYDLEWVDDPRIHEGVEAAYKLNQQQGRVTLGEWVLIIAPTTMPPLILKSRPQYRTRRREK